MERQVFYPIDIRNALLAAEQAVNATANAAIAHDDPFTAGFLTGYRAALTTLALAFGLTNQSRDLATRTERYIPNCSNIFPETVASNNKSSP